MKRMRPDTPSFASACHRGTRSGRVTQASHCAATVATTGSDAGPGRPRPDQAVIQHNFFGEESPPMRTLFRKLPAVLGAAALAAGAGTTALAHNPDHDHGVATATPIRHLVVIYDENVSFDHYFATYPSATNPSGEPSFNALPGTPKVNNLVSANLLTNNPNFTNAKNGANAAEPFRLDRTQAATADQNHGYTAEQEAYDGGAADLFPLNTGNGTAGGVGAFGTKGRSWVITTATRRPRSGTTRNTSR